MRLTVPQIADVPPDLGEEVDRAIDADLIEEGFARIARVLNGGIGPENLASGFGFNAADFQQSKHICPLSVSHDFLVDPVPEPAWIPLGSIYAQASVVSLRVACIQANGSAVIGLYSGHNGAMTQVGANLVQSAELWAPLERYVYWYVMDPPGDPGLPYEYGLPGPLTVSAGRTLWLRISNTAAAHVAWVAGTAELAMLHQG